MPNITGYESPLTGKKGRVTDLGGLLRLVLGGVVMIGVFYAANSIFGRLRSLAPAPLANVLGRVNPAASAESTFGDYGV